MKSKWNRNFLKYDENGELRPYYVGLHGEIHEVRHGVDTAYPAPSGYSQVIDGKCWLLINGLRCVCVEDIYGLDNQLSHTSMIIYKEPEKFDDFGNKHTYKEQLILDPEKEPRVDIIKQAHTPEKYRFEPGCSRTSEPFI